jgi:putative spermidine/putrescine transport system substrate-binding protein
MKRRSAPVLLVALCVACTTPKSTLTPVQFTAMSWDDVVSKARGSEVAFAMWTGDEDRNRYFRSKVASVLETKFGIKLRIVPLADTADAVNKLLNEKGAGETAGGSIDMIWINGENFRTAKQGGLLWGPFAPRLPNIQLYDDAVGKRDFGTPIEGLEAPWEKSQFVMAYDSVRTPEPPKTIEALRTWIKAHPGRFTYIAPPDFTGSVFIRHVMVHLAGRDPGFWTGFDDKLYQRASAGAVAYLNDIRPYLWRRGETYPSTGKELNRLFANNEVDFAMSYGPSFASVKIAKGEFPKSVRTFVFDEGTIGNYNFLAIPFNVTNAAGAVIAINELMSFDQILDITQALGEQFPLSLDRLSGAQKIAVAGLPTPSATLPIAELRSHFLPEPDAGYLTRLEKDWLEKVLRQ